MNCGQFVAGQDRTLRQLTAGRSSLPQCRSPANTLPEGRTRLTSDRGENIFPAWSSDGKHIVFTSNRDGNDEVYVINADGSGQTNLTHNPASDGEPSW